jgi:arylsulfatase
MMEGDYHLGQVMDALKEMNIEDNTILVFASDNGTTGQSMMAWDRQGLGAPDIGSNGPFRGDLGEPTEGAVRTFCIIRWPGHTIPGSTSYAMFSIMDFMPTFADIVGVKLPTDRAIDGVNQREVLTGKSSAGNRESLLSFIGPDLVAARWKQWRVYFKDTNRTGTGQQMVGGVWANTIGMYYPKFYNIELDPHEDYQMTNYSWTGGPVFKVVQEYLESVKKFPNPPPSNVTNFSQPLR